jgi:hypothetical protein
MTDFSPVLHGLRPVFVVGHPRSGTTLVQQLLTAHPALWSAPETHLFSDVFAKIDNWQNRPVQPDELELIFKRLSRKPRITLPEEARAAIAAAADRGTLGPAHLLDAIMRALKPVESSATRWLEKTPRHVYLLGLILRWFPDASVIHVLRDPRGVASSPVRFGQLQPGFERSALVVERGDSWNAVVDLIESMHDEPRVLTVRYEDLVADREAALTQITSHIGVEYDPGVFERFGSTYEQITVSSENVRKQLNSTGEIVDRRTVYRERMTPDEIALIDTICRDRMQRHGYIPDGDPRSELVEAVRAQIAAQGPKLPRTKAGGRSHVARLMRATQNFSGDRDGPVVFDPDKPADGSTLRRWLTPMWRRLWWLFLRAERKIPALKQLRLRFRRYESEVYFISFPKSGRTWVRFVLGRAIQRRFRLSEDRKLVLVPKLYRRATGLKIKISHDSGARLDAGYSGTDKSRYAGKRVFFLTRDIRDTLVSYYHHRLDRNREIQMTVSEYVRSDIYGARKIALFYKAWHDNQHLPSTFLRVRYEDLRQEPLRGMRLIADFLLLGYIEDGILRTACGEGDFAKMQALERKNEIVILQRGGDASKLPENATRVRKGKVGGYHEELSEEDITFIDRVVDEVGVPRSWVYADPAPGKME